MRAACSHSPDRAELSAQAGPLLRNAGQSARLCASLTTEGWALGALGDRERARTVLEEALQLARGDYAQALEFNEACLEIIERAGDPLNVAIVLGNVGESRQAEWSLAHLAQYGPQEAEGRALTLEGAVALTASTGGRRLSVRRRSCASR